MQAKKVEDGYFLRIDKGEEIMATITDFVAVKSIPAGAISGIGALTEVELGYFDREKSEYLRRNFNNIYELLSLTGNISYIDQNPMVHAHCILGDSDYRLVGGHLFNAVVAVTGEVHIRTFNERFERAMNPELNLNLLAF
ncbi:MAG: DNA-binding protein [candidate division Zixibacteria bacterium]|nr:DNA-binding protein [candidate division Zixibacteria bacterium]